MLGNWVFIWYAVNHIEQVGNGALLSQIARGGGRHWECQELQRTHPRGGTEEGTGHGRGYAAR